MKPSSSPPSSLLLLPLLALVAGPFAPVRTEEFSERIEVRVVEVPVLVLSHGQPVLGLTRENFEIYDRGVVQEMTGFEMIELSPLEGRRSGARPLPPEHPAQRHFLLLFDLAFAERPYLARAVSGARAMALSQLHPTDRVAVGVYAPYTGPRLILGFTTDREQVDFALAVVEAILDADRTLQRQRLQALRELQQPSEEDDAGRLGQLRRLATELSPTAALVVGVANPTWVASSPPSGVPSPADRGIPAADPLPFVLPGVPGDLGTRPTGGPGLSAIRDLSLSMADFITLLRDVPGQKQFIYFSQGFASGFLQDALALDYVGDMLEAFRRGGWTLQSVDIQGIPDGFHRGFSADALFYLANETGGQLYENYNRIEAATEKLVQRSRVTYLLSFEPRELVADGSYHRLEVKLKGGPPDAKVIHRPGYHASKPLAKRTPLERRLDAAELILAGVEVTQFEAAALAIALPSPSSPSSYVPVLVEIPGAPFVGTEEARPQLEIQAYALDRQQGIHGLLAHTVQLDLRKVGETLGRGGLRFLGEMELPPDEYEIRVLVQNLQTQELSVVKTPVSVGSADATEPRLLPPLLLDATEDWLFLGEKRSKKKLRDQLCPTATRREGFVPAIEPSLRPLQTAELCLVAYALGTRDLLLSSRVLTRDGVEAGGGDLELLRRVSRDDGLDQFFGTFRASGLAAGAYRLEIILSDRETGFQTTSSLDFVVEG